jgi:hypothetical protein
MSLETKVGKQFLDILDVISNSIALDLIGKNGEEFNLSSEDLEKVLTAVQSTVKTSGDKCLTALVKCIKE